LLFNVHFSYLAQRAKTTSRRAARQLIVLHLKQSIEGEYQITSLLPHSVPENIVSAIESCSSIKGSS